MKLIGKSATAVAQIGITVVMNGQWLKLIRFKLPIIENDLSIDSDNGEHIETVALLSRKKQVV